MPLDRSTWEMEHRLEIGRLIADALPAGLYGKPTLEAFVRALGHGCQLLEDRIAGQHLALTLDGANGTDLNIFGRLVGELREGLTDAPYRRLIRARLLANKSEGLPDELVRIAELATGGESYCFNFTSPAGYRHYIVVPSPIPNEVVGRIRRLLVAVATAGATPLIAVIVEGDLGDPDTDLTTSGLLSAPMAQQLYP